MDAAEWTHECHCHLSGGLGIQASGRMMRVLMLMVEVHCGGQSRVVW
ncbi:hypothetical protein HMPREF1861_02323 [Corynebacterium kroppenstedtii]|nr:hypothetical protein HMPREF1861_02323 [Corynebacterium kroppenstedtii]